MFTSPQLERKHNYNSELKNDFTVHSYTDLLGNLSPIQFIEVHFLEGHYSIGAVVIWKLYIQSTQTQVLFYDAWVCLSVSRKAECHHLHYLGMWWPVTAADLAVMAKFGGGIQLSCCARGTKFACTMGLSSGLSLFVPHAPTSVLDSCWGGRTQHWFRDGVVVRRFV